MPSSYPNYDYDQEQAQLQQRLKVMEALQTGALAPMGPTEVIGGYAVKRSPLEALSKVAQAYFAGKQIKSINDEQRGLADRYKGDLKTGIQQFIDGISAQPGQVIPEQQGNNPSAYVPQQTLDATQSKDKQMKAVLDAIASNHPVLQGIGTSYLSSMGKDKITAKELLPYADPKTGIPGLVNNGVSGFVPKKTQPKEVNGVVYDPDSLQILQLKGGNPPSQVKIDGDLYEVNASTGQLKKLDNAPKITTNVRVPVNVVNQGESKFMQTLGEKSAEDLVKVKQEKYNSQQVITSMQKLEQLDRQGVYSGPTAPASQFVGSLAESIGIPVDKSKLASSQAYQGELMSNMQQFLTGSIARSTTDKDAEMLRAPLPQLINSPEGRAVLRRQVIAKAQERIEYADSVQRELEKQFPEAGRLNALTPGSQPSPKAGAVRRFNPATGKIE